MKYLWFAIIFAAVFLLLLNVIKLVGVSLNFLFFYRLGKLYMESKSIFCDYETLSSLIKASGMEYSFAYKNDGIILLREKINIFSLNIFLKLRTIIIFENGKYIIKIMYDNIYLYYFFLFISILFFPMVIIIFGNVFGLIIYILTFLFYSLVQNKILEKILSRYEKLIEFVFYVPFKEDETKHVVKHS